MARHLLFVVFISVGLGGQPPGDSVKKDLELFQGRWEAVAAQSMDGKPLSEELLKTTNLVVKGDTFTMKSGGTTIDGTFKIDPTKKPKTIDVFVQGSEVPSARGIYEINGDTRKSCFVEGSKARPDGFRKGEGFLLLEWKKAK
jgi:uncharacterized protein (TIGR03067 family)